MNFKNLVFSLFLLTAVPVFAENCPQISGMYELNLDGEKSVLGFRIQNCQEITLIQEGLPDVAAKMNGEVTDLGGEGSLSVTFDADHVYVSIVSKPSPILDLVLGEYTSSTNTLSLDADKNLVIEAVYKNAKGEVTHRDSLTARRVEFVPVP